MTTAGTLAIGASVDRAAAARVRELEEQLREAQETIEAITSGEVDAVLVGSAEDRQIYSLTTADRPYRLLIEQMAEGAFTLSADGVILYVNGALEGIVGLPQHRLIGGRFIDHFSTPSQLTPNALSLAGKVKGEVRVGNDGAAPVQFSLTRIIDDGETLYCGVVTDLSAAVTQATELADARAEAQLGVERRQSEERLRFALEAGDLGSWTLDLVTYELSCSDQCKTIFGRTNSDRFDYSDLQGAIHPGDRDRMVRTVEACVAERQDYAIVYRVVHPDGVERRVQVKGRPVYADDGTPLYMSGVSVDVTDRVEQEEALKTAGELLERRVAERTLELEQVNQRLETEIAERLRTEAQLRQTQKIEALGQLTGGIAHDFNNLLAAVMGNIELVQKRLPADTEPRILKMLGGAMQGAERGAILTRRLLAFARQQELRRSAVDLAPLLDGMDDLLARTLGPTIQLRVNVPRDVSPVIADPHQLELAILNLAVNARDAMSNDGTLTISAANQEIGDNDMGLAAGAYVCIRVTDDGEGMSDETRQKASEPFFTTKGVGKGTGLGLSMVHGLMAQFDGLLTIDSELGRGTTINLLLPSAAALEKEPATKVAAAQVEAGEMRPLRILFVDDDMLVREATQAMLEELGHDVVVMSSAKDALQRLSEDQDFDRVITDHAMPDMTGAELITEAQTRWPDLTFLLATGFTELSASIPADVRRLSKPFKRADLAEALCPHHLSVQSA